MSTTEQERETEYITGTITAIVQKGPDKWQVAVQPDGSQYTKNLWTKDSALVISLQGKIGSHGAFVCGVSHWTTGDGKPVRSLWINSAEDPGRLDDLHVKPQTDGKGPGGGRGSNPAPSTGGGNGMTKEEWAAKDAAIHFMAAIKAATAALTHTIPSDPSTEQLNQFVENVLLVARQFRNVVVAERDGEAPPF